MNFNANLVSTIVVGLGMALIGAFLNGQRIHSKQDREKIKEIEKIQKDTQFKIDSIYAHSVLKERAMLVHIDSVYQLLDQIYEQKVVSERQYARYKANIASQRKKVKAQWDQLGRPFIYKSN